MTRPLTTGTAESICTRIKGVQMRVRKVTGTALANDATGEVAYTPPEGEARIRDLLAVTREHALEPWLLYMLRAVEDTAGWTTTKIGAVRKLAASTAEYVRAKLPTLPIARGQA